MLTKFWEKVVENVAGEWTLRMLTPAFAFWGIGTLVWALQNGWDKLTDRLYKDTTEGVALLIAGVFVLAVSAALVNWLTLPILRLVEGYYPWFFKPLRFWFARRFNKPLEKKYAEWEQLAMKFKSLNTKEQQCYVELEAEISCFPKDPNLLMPTFLGNLLRAAEEYPKVRYGLETITVFPRLWLVMPETTRTNLGTARQVLDDRTRLMTWCLLSAVWTIFAWWVFIPALFAAWLCYRSMIDAAGAYCELLRSAFDLHRFELYRSLSLPLPTNPQDEKPQGEALTIYLKRGMMQKKIDFVFKKEE